MARAFSSVEPRLFAVFALLACAGGCMRLEGRNADCRWPGEIGNHPPTSRHLSADAEFAEDLAIRYADRHYGLHTPGWVSWEVYGDARDRCMAEQFDQIAKEHGVSAEAVSASLGQNRVLVDLAESLTFLFFYCVAAVKATRILWRSYAPIDHAWIAPGIMLVFISLVFAIGGTMLGEIWSGLVESFRIGNGHLSYRSWRLLWSRHHIELFVGMLILFWLVAAEMYRRSQPGGSSSSDPANIAATSR